jgi:hypothetical protein
MEIHFLLPSVYCSEVLQMATALSIIILPGFLTERVWEPRDKMFSNFSFTYTVTFTKDLLKSPVLLQNASKRRWRLGNFWGWIRICILKGPFQRVVQGARDGPVLPPFFGFPLQGLFCLLSAFLGCLFILYEVPSHWGVYLWKSTRDLEQRSVHPWWGRNEREIVWKTIIKIQSSVPSSSYFFR